MSQVRPDLWHVQLDLMFQLFNPFHPFFSFKGYETRQLSQILLKQTEKATKNMIDVGGIAENLPSFYDFFPISEPILSRLIETYGNMWAARLGARGPRRPMKWLALVVLVAAKGVEVQEAPRLPKVPHVFNEGADGMPHLPDVDTLLEKYQDTGHDVWLF